MHEFQSKKHVERTLQAPIIAERRGGVAWINVYIRRELSNAWENSESLSISTGEWVTSFTCWSKINRRVFRCPGVPPLLFGEDVTAFFGKFGCVHLCALFGWRQRWRRRRALLSTTTVCFARYLAADSSAANAQSVSTHAAWSHAGSCVSDLLELVEWVRDP